MIKENFIKLYENSFKENWDLIFPVTQIMVKIPRLHTDK